MMLWIASNRGRLILFGVACCRLVLHVFACCCALIRPVFMPKLLLALARDEDDEENAEEDSQVRVEKYRGCVRRRDEEER